MYRVAVAVIAKDVILVQGTTGSVDSHALVLPHESVHEYNPITRTRVVRTRQGNFERVHLFQHVGNIYRFFKWKQGQVSWTAPCRKGRLVHRVGTYCRLHPVVDNANSATSSWMVFARRSAISPRKRNHSSQQPIFVNDWATRVALANVASIINESALILHTYATATATARQVSQGLACLYVNRRTHAPPSYTYMTNLYGRVN
jgi:hypothetical protein